MAEFALMTVRPVAAHQQRGVVAPAFQVPLPIKPSAKSNRPPWSSARLAAVEDAESVGDARRMEVGDDGVAIQLSRDEALVLFEWLHRSEDEDRVIPPEHHGEQVALWNLSALLERALVEPLKQNYRQLVAEARDRLAGNGLG